MNLNKNKAFTLVELIVVITILAILGTIAFISLQGYSMQSRDSARISDMGIIESSLELYKLDGGKYPETTNGTIITFSGGEVWSQGTFGETSFSSVYKINKIPTDPLTDKEYIYSVINNRQEYQIAGVVEGDVFGIKTNKTGQANAVLKTGKLKISGKYNGKLLKVSSGSIDYILSVPSIITSTGATLEYIISNNKLAYNGYKILPFQYDGSNYVVEGETKLSLLNTGSLVVYSGSLSTLSDTTQIGVLARAKLVENLQNAYTGTILSNIGEIKSILGVDLNNPTQTEILSTAIVANNLGGTILAGSAGTQVVTPASITKIGNNLGSHTCAVYSDGKVKCWGKNTYGQLGDGTTSNSFTPVEVSGITNALSVDGGDNTNCALLSDGTIKCWGRGNWGQLGNNTTSDSHTPVLVSGITNAVKLDFGRDHACAVLSDSTAKCWGTNGFGRLGDGTTTQRNTPVTVTGSLSTITSISAGDNHTCAVLSDGTVRCWGVNWGGELGNGTTTQSNIPVTVTGINTATDIYVLSDEASCAILSDSTVKCWGSNSTYQLGDGTSVNKNTPVSVIGGLTGVTKITGGYGNYSALLSNGTVKSWGLNSFGQLGNGNTTNQATPIDTGLSNVNYIAAGWSHVCAVLNSGGVKCWGFNNLGQLGDGTTTSSSTPINATSL